MACQERVGTCSPLHAKIRLGESPPTDGAIMDQDDFPDFDFSALSEADVREEVIAPVLRRLGYRSGTENSVIREKAIEIRYPHMFLGRKKPDKDPVLRGRPDYICEARNITRWAIEAKPPSEDIQRGDVEQAHSYAVHPELAAPLFVLCNGREWLIFESNRGPAAEPLLRLSHDDVRSQFHLLQNLLSPAGLNRRFPVQTLDRGRPLAAGHGSRAAIVGGFTRYDEIHSVIEGLPPGVTVPGADQAQRLVGYKAAIIGEACTRSDEFGIVADIKMHIPHDSVRGFAEKIGIDRNRYVTRAEVISENPTAPTIFEFMTECALPAGSTVFDMTRWSNVTTPLPVHMAWYAEAIGHLAGTTFRGTYSSRMLAEPQGGLISIKQWLFMRGAFEVELRPI